MDEIWKDIPGYEGMYQVSDLGRVKSVSRKDARGRNRKERILQNNPNASGHHQVKLYKDGNTKYPYVHRMVLEAFVGPPPKEKPNALHCDDDPSNNKLENLRWGSQSENRNDAVRNGRDYNANKTHCVNGHLFSGENLRVRSDGRRACRTCESYAWRKSVGRP